MTDAEALFGPEQVERARRYHRPLYAVSAASLGVALAVLAALAFVPLPGIDDLPWPEQTAALAALAHALPALVRLPFAFWAGYRRERRFGFSTQSLGGWLVDRAKGFGLGLVLTTALLLGLVALVRALPSAWPLAAAAAGAAAVALFGFVAPVVLEPLFNRFRPLADERLARELRGLAELAATPVREVLVADASRRTRKVNAYVSGLGRTRRVVLYDTLLDRADTRQTRLVVAHELGHRRMRHVVKGTVLAMLGAAGFVVVLWALLQWDALLRAIGASAPGDPRIVPFVVLLATALELLALPLGAAVSRRWEREADRFSLELTRDPEAFEEAHRELATANLTDLDPPRLVYLTLFSHPTPPQRIDAGRRWAARYGSD